MSEQRSHERTGFTGFTDSLDRDGEKHQLQMIDNLDIQNEMAMIRAIKQPVIDLMRINLDDTVLDLGSGTGDDTRVLAELVGPGGKAIGVDVSEVMVAEARQRAEESGLPVEFVVGDAHALPFEDSTFDSCRSERTFQWIEDPKQAVAELVRVTKPGGRVVVVEADWDASINRHGDAEIDMKITEAMKVNRPGGLASSQVARDVPELFHRAGLADIEIVPSYGIGRLDKSFVERIYQAGLDLGAITADEFSKGLKIVDEHYAAGIGYHIGLLIIVAGIKPTS